MSELENNKLVKISNNYYINKKRITYIKTDTNYSYDYIRMKKYHIYIYFTGENYIELSTYIKEEFEKWLEELL